MFQPGDIVRVPFPYVENERVGHRPALVVRVFEPVAGLHLLWTLMITTARNTSWNGDILVGERHAEFGLPVPCVIRTGKIATIEIEQAEYRGRIPAALFDQVLSQLAADFAV